MVIPETVDRDACTLTLLNETDADDLLTRFPDPGVTERLDIEPLVDRAGADAIIRWATDTLLPFLVTTRFKSLGLQRTAASASPGNGRSARALARHGFRNEGTLHDDAHWKGRFWDRNVYARIAE